MFGFFRRRRRPKLKSTPLPDAWWAIIDKRVPLVRDMDGADRRELGGIVQILLAEKRFVGLNGLEITDEIRVTIAAQAALLLMHRETDYYPTLKTIHVYPHGYFAPTTRRNPDGTITEGRQARLGESWFRGSLVLSWSDVVHGAAIDDDGRNLVLHEFAHQLDGEWGGMEGAPALRSASSYRDWARVLGGEYERLIQDIHRGHHTTIDAYGATNPAEFFAVVTELFFERPGALKRDHPELYGQFVGFYGRDPAG